MVAKMVLQLSVNIRAKITLSASSAESPAARLRRRWQMVRTSMVVSSTAIEPAKTPVA